jgi:hypothetical protein
MNGTATGRVDYIKSHIVGDISFQSTFAREIAKTMLAILKIRDLDEATFILSMLELLRGFEQRHGLFLHETKKAAFNMPALTDEEAAEVERFLNEYIGKDSAAMTLEQYLRETLGLETKPSMDPDNMTSPGLKLATVAQLLMCAENLEDFMLKVPRGRGFIKDAVIDQAIIGYYQSLNCEMTVKGSGDRLGNIVVILGEQKVSPNYSNGGHIIVVSVNPFPW